MARGLGRTLAAGLTLAVVSATAGCGGGGSDATTTTTTTTAKQSSAARPAGLAKPLFPRCGTARLPMRQVTPISRGGRKTWQIVYRVPQNAPKIEGLTTIVTLLELPPSVPRGKVEGGRETTMSGHAVSLRLAATSADSNIARWRTSRATYIVLADGNTQALKRLVECLP